MVEALLDLLVVVLLVVLDYFLEGHLVGKLDQALPEDEVEDARGVDRVEFHEVQHDVLADQVGPLQQVLLLHYGVAQLVGDGLLVDRLALFVEDLDLIVVGAAALYDGQHHVRVDQHLLVRERLKERPRVRLLGVGLLVELAQHHRQLLFDSGVVEGVRGVPAVQLDLVAELVREVLDLLVAFPVFLLPMMGGGLYKTMRAVAQLHFDAVLVDQLGVLGLPVRMLEGRLVD